MTAEQLVLKLKQLISRAENGVSNSNIIRSNNNNNNMNKENGSSSFNNINNNQIVTANYKEIDI